MTATMTMPAERETGAVRVVIADDHPLVVASLSRLLEQAGHQVVGVTANASDGVDRALALRPDVFVVDLHMPGGGGVVAAANVLSKDASQTVVMISAAADPVNVRAALDAGCRGFVSKLAGEDEILAVISAAANGELAMDRRSATSLIAAERRRSSEIDRFGLNERELEVLTALAEGLSNPAIAQRLNVSRSTVAGAVSSIFSKLGVQDRTAAAIEAWRSGLIRE
jgi:DNA-binding NarL/FixJ family response regulator